MYGKGSALIQVKTTRFGELAVKPEDVITLPSGLIGFPELKKYVLLDHDKGSPFKWFQSLDDGAIAFVLINPLLFKPDYSVEVSEGEVSDLDFGSEEDAVISVIITMPSNPMKMTANLKAPLIFNLKNRKGKQIILSKADYTTRHNVMDEVKKREIELEQLEKLEQVENGKKAQQAVADLNKDSKKTG